MKKRFTEEPIIESLREAGSGERVKNQCWRSCPLALIQFWNYMKMMHKTRHCAT